MSTIKEIRQISGLKRAEFCRKYKIPVRTMEDWEYGHNDPPNYIKELMMRAVKYDKMEGESKMLNEFKKFHLKKHVYDELEKYLTDIDKYKKEQISSIELKNSYELVYTSLKHQWRLGRISEQDFYRLKEELSEAAQ